MEIDVPNESIGCRAVIEENGFLLTPVSPDDSGEGLPYAPIDWPNPGDNWSWKVGRRIRNYGYYQDRYLYLPSRLQNPSRRKECFASKLSVERYIRTEFPGANVDAFFASFSWNVLSKEQSETKVKNIPLPSKVPPQVEAKKVKGKEVGEEQEVPQNFLRKRKQRPATLSAIFKRRTRQSSKRFVPFTTKDSVTIDLCSLTEETGTSDPTTKDLKSTTDFESDQASGHHANISPASSIVATCHSPVTCKALSMDPPQESPAEVIPVDFDNYLNSLEDILAQPLFEAPLFPTEPDNSPALEEELAEARWKLSSLLGMEFPLLVFSKNLTELTVLASKLQKDPSLSADQLSKLKLIEEIPLTSKDFLETKEIIEQADKFFADLETNITKATSLRKEYCESKEKAAQLQAEVDDCSSALREIDDQIAQLQSRRAELTGAVEIKKKAKVEWTSTQRMVADSLPKVVSEVQLANSKKLEWELKKKNSAKREAEILAKFAPLKGFSF